MPYVCLHALTDQEKVRVAKRFKEDILLSGFTHQAIADKLDVSQSTIAGWSTGRLLIPIWRTFDLQKKTNALFLVERLRPDFVRKFQPVIDTLCSHKFRKESMETATQFNVRRERERGEIK